MSTEQLKPRIGFIGLGIMGKPMAQNLLKAGYPLTVYNRSPEKMTALVEAGARPAESCRAVAEASDVVITIVTDSPDVHAVCLGENGIRAGARPGLIVVDMSTISPTETQTIANTLAEDGIHMLDAPVSGGDIGAQRATLSIMVGGEEAIFDIVHPIFSVLGKNTVHVGPSGMGQTVKLANQIVGAINILAVAEGLSFAAKAGADVGKALQVIGGGAAGSWMLENLGPRMAARDFSPGFMVGLQQKDLRLALDAAGQVHLPLPGTALVNQLFAHVEAAGCSSEGTQALVKAIEALGGHEVGR